MGQQRWKGVVEALSEGHSGGQQQFQADVGLVRVSVIHGRPGQFNGMPWTARLGFCEGSGGDGVW